MKNNYPNSYNKVYVSSRVLENSRRNCLYVYTYIYIKISKNKYSLSPEKVHATEEYIGILKYI